jgi:hypothetical protein
MQGIGPPHLHWWPQKNPLLVVPRFTTNAVEEEDGDAIPSYSILT